MMIYETKLGQVFDVLQMKEAFDDAIAKCIVADEIYSAPPSVPLANPTWLDLQDHEVNYNFIIICLISFSILQTAYYLH